MSMRVQMEIESVRARLVRGDPYWPAQLTVAAAIGLNVALSERVTVGPTWLLPSVEGALLAVLIVVAPARANSHSHGVRRFALAVIALVSLANLVSLAMLVHFLVNGGHAGRLGSAVGAGARDTGSRE